ncbi:hypothetical protein IEQ34_008573 [Dendrobium chrysotoxum]|uniref:Uncharacterized protein n=1 Tax=Dendrobium chrysotoxum TaxID=161865 RepID=A0AAV7GZF5_DENCH|nr:hypothetical protein IEQ34_008573 [Dendrobium chrysotoxum]
MAAIAKLFLASLTLLYLSQVLPKKLALGHCELSDIEVEQKSTGEIVKGKTEYEVVINNTCICTQYNIHLDCNGFNTVVSIDPTKFRKIDDYQCSVNNEHPVFTEAPIVFKYAWDIMFDLNPIYSTIACS